ncbi:hypothetical protein M885DRAFT_588106 [Pelagophyceae sp. CCMP2097]|nr:hypothetical protein M885DRAFT_588106 [Pelagophyceae sp. CCMP2097]
MSPVAQGRMIVEVVFADDRTEKIHVREGDVALELAQKFAHEFNLPAAYEAVLTAQIEASIVEDARRRNTRGDRTSESARHRNTRGDRTSESAPRLESPKSEAASVDEGTSSERLSEGASSERLSSSGSRDGARDDGARDDGARDDGARDRRDDEGARDRRDDDGAREGSGDDDDEEERYARAVAAFQAQGKKGAGDVAAKARGSAVSWMSTAGVQRGKPPRETSQSKKQSATFSRLHGDANRMDRRRERVVERRRALEDEARKGGMYKANDKSSELALRMNRAKAPGSRGAAAAQHGIHERLYAEAKGKDPLQDQGSSQSASQLVEARQDWLCPRCGAANRFDAAKCDAAHKSGIALSDKCPSAWVWAKRESLGGAFPACGQPRPVLHHPTICAPKSRALIDAWRGTEKSSKHHVVGRRDAGRGSSEDSPDVWEALYKHASEANVVAEPLPDVEATFAPKIDRKSRAIVREKLVVSAIMDALKDDDGTAQGQRRAELAARAAYAAALQAAPRESAIHDRLFQEAAQRNETKRLNEQVDSSTFVPDTGRSLWQSRGGVEDACDQKLLDSRLCAEKLRVLRCGAPLDDSRDSETGQKLFAPLMASRGPAAPPSHRGDLADGVHGSSRDVHAALHAEHRSAADGRARAAVQAREALAQRSSVSHVSSKSRALLVQMRHSAYRDVWAAMQFKGDSLTCVELLSDQAAELRFQAQCVLREAPWADFDGFCALMDLRLDVARSGAPNAFIISQQTKPIRTKTLQLKKDVAEEKVAKTLEACTFRPDTSNTSGYTPPKPRRPGLIEHVLRDAGDRYSQSQRDRELADDEMTRAACTFRPTLLAKQPKAAQYPLSRRYGSDDAEAFRKPPAVYYNSNASQEAPDAPAPETPPQSRTK